MLNIRLLLLLLLNIRLLLLLNIRLLLLLLLNIRLLLLNIRLLFLFGLVIHITSILRSEFCSLALLLILLITCRVCGGDC
ncbi:hypothetical protein TRFO_15675 [Tritrichomonas foetus]|uniref:Uncharacterized protein n=1 Tax=Tritrichomonas foetus TaxID=1144522 RepID=A0A1J4KW96_9EUKA|nr:hypothetical protein TRFO_15675 [Tritrichomonas foetus]|eukprot:OHT14020.1 hypothetical protein TRFO_15675 [Tritrichomonas foetus]